MPAESPSRLDRLAAVLPSDQRWSLEGDPATTVDDVHHDSREVTPGSLFVAIPGSLADGHRFIDDAIARGATAVTLERARARVLPVPALVVEDSRAALPLLAAEVHGNPSQALTVIGITGTNGKTTVTHMIESIVHASGMRSGVVGTVGARVAGVAVPVTRTTPESSDLQRLLARMVTAGVHVAALEVSSHALALGRVDGTRFRVAGFTNLSQDHLDFHHSMDAYFSAKASLFVPERADRAVIWVDDPAGVRLCASTTLPVTRVAFTAAGDVVAEDLVSTIGGSSFVLVAGDERRAVRLPAPGTFNVSNALVAAACCLEAGIPLSSVVQGLDRLGRVPGRFEPVDVGQAFAAIVDYAHGPDAIAAMIRQGRAIGSGRVIVVLGAGGDRDRAKRPMMGEAAAEADLVFITSDNPRSEDPQSIIDSVVAGARGGNGEVVIESDRRLAMRRAVESASEGDVVLVLGKGHEQGQEFAGGRIVPFDDRQVLAEELAALGRRQGADT